MALRPLQRDVCRLLADERRARRESYIAGGVALSVALETARISRVLDVFHDTTEAVARTAEWARDSAFRFFPLVEHAELGLTLHPFDLATNKVLALIGRLEPRDWIDVIACDERVQPLGYLAWAACGKDPGFTPHGILNEGHRSARYSEEELSALAFDGPAPRAADMSRQWHRILSVAATIVERLPADRAGHAVLSTDAGLFRGDATAFEAAVRDNRLVFHAGRIGGALPIPKR